MQGPENRGAGPVVHAGTVTGVPDALPAPAPGNLKGPALLAQLERVAFAELAVAPRSAAMPAHDPLLGCMDWDLGVPGSVAAVR